MSRGSVVVAQGRVTATVATMLPAAGMLLVASVALREPTFRQSVIYLIEHDQDGSLGFIINRPLDVTLSELWGECPPGLDSDRVAADGGPVERQKGLLLHACADLHGAQPMGEGLAVGGDLEALARRYADGSDHTGPRLFLGHSGWSPGQLQSECEAGVWILRPGTKELVVASTPIPHLWKMLVEGRTGLPDPSEN